MIFKNKTFWGKLINNEAALFLVQASKFNKLLSFCILGQVLYYIIPSSLADIFNLLATRAPFY